MKKQKCVVYKKNIKGIKPVLVPVATVGLIALLAGKLFSNKTSGFEYNQDSFVNLSDQLENYLEIEIDEDEKEVLDTLRNYEIAYDNYYDTRKEDEGTRIEARKDLIDESSSLIHAAKEMIRLKAIDYLQCSREATMHIDDLTNKEDGPEYELVITDKGVSHRLKINQKVSKLINDIFVIGEYSGNGTNKVWDKAIKGYGKTTEEMYNLVLELSTLDCKFTEVNQKTR